MRGNATNVEGAANLNSTLVDTNREKKGAMLLTLLPTDMQGTKLARRMLSNK